jgi:hypothetical protein
VQRRIEEAIRKAREAARQATGHAAGTVSTDQDEESAPDVDEGTADVKPVPEQERQDIKRAVEEGRRIRMGMQSTGGTGGD